MTTPAGDASSTMGGRIASRIAQTVVEATLKTRAATGGIQAGVAQHVLADFTNHVSDEIRGVMGATFRRFAEAPDTPEEMRPMLRALATERGQAWAWIGGQMAAGAVTPSLMQVINNQFAPAVGGFIAEFPNARHSPSTVANALARDIDPGFNWEYEAKQGGINPERLEHMVKLARSPMPLDAALTVARRSPRSEDAARVFLRQAGLEDRHVDHVLQLLHVPLSPEQLAAMWNRDIVSTEEGEKTAALSGVSKEDFSRLTQLGGDPPGVQELLIAWQRGVITEAQVDRALVQGPLRKEWIPVIKQLRWVPLPLAEAADAVNQGHLSIEDAYKVAAEHGVRADDFDVAVANAGIPPGPQTILDWVNRGLITEQEALEGLYESRIKNRWVPKYLESRYETIPPESVRLIYSRGAMTREDAIRRLQMRGLSPEDSEMYLAAASADKTQATRDLTVSQVLELFADRMILADDASAMLGALGYEPDETAWLIELADLRRVRKFVSAATTRIRSTYVAGLLSESEANARLDSLGMPAEYKDDVLALWDLERATVSKGLTTAQIVSAVKKGALTLTAGMARLQGQGYDESDAVILLQIGGALDIEE